MAGQASIVLDAKNIVGESIIYDERRETLFWVDIIAKQINSLHLPSEQHRSWQTPSLATSIGLRRDGGYIVGLEKTVVLWDGDQDFQHFVHIEPDLPDNRLNEGVIGPDGCLWVGTMQNNVNPDGSPKDMTASTGRLYRVTPDAQVKPLSDDLFGITNTLAWTDDGRLFTADTLENTLYAYPWDAQAGRLGVRSNLLASFDRGLPDGSCMDAEGYLWNCRVVGGNCLIRVDGDGRIDRVVELPCSWPTSCTFGGPEFATLYVTSARFTQTDDHLAAAPSEGALFAVDVGVRGKPSHRFG